MEDGSKVLPAIRVRESESFDFFTEVDLEAAELLVQLSGSTNGGESACSTSSSPRSVNTWRSPVREAEEEMEMAGPARKRRRYRLLSDLYKSMETKKSKKREREEEEEWVAEL